MSQPILPPAMLGLLGGGQLGRMFVAAARRMGYEVMVLDPDPQAPAAHFATRHICADYSDAAALAELVNCAAITTEFENPPAATLAALAEKTLVRPGAFAVGIAQDRIREKRFFQENGFPVGNFAVIETAKELSLARSRVKFPAILKSARYGYDGKGQVKVERGDDLEAAWAAINHAAAVLEELLPLTKEVSVILARSADGETALFPTAENRHTRGILDVSVVPADLQPHLALEARDIAQRLAARLDYVGVLGVEMFLVRSQILLNEIAPRPHNSGHFTLDATVTCQFEQQVRTLCGLPLGDPALVLPAAMVNILGDAWGRSGPASRPDWELLLAEPGVHLHLYGKAEARRGRKMGHFTVCRKTREEALAVALRLREAIGGFSR